MKPQPHKKALAHLEKAEKFAQRLASHLTEARTYLSEIQNSDKPTPGKKRKAKRR